MGISKQVAIAIVIPLLLIGLTTLVALYGKGYRLSFVTGKPEIAGTGILVTKSIPDGAEVFINGHLTTATDNTLNLVPGEYTVRIFKEGYFPWEKKIIIQKEVVGIADALLFPMAPKLDSITASGVHHPVIDPTMTRLAYTVASQSARKNGIYVLDLTSRPLLTLQSNATQIADDTIGIFSTADISWTPDGKSLIASIAGELATTTYLLDSGSYNDTPQDITATLANNGQVWQKELQASHKAKVAAFGLPLQKIINQNFTNIQWSPDDTKILYTASTSATLPIILQPRMIGANSTPEDRNIQANDIYIYDTKEDRNYKILDVPEPTPTPVNEQEPSVIDKPLLAWLYDSKHILRVQNKRVEIMDYDGLNATTVYAGPFMDNYVFAYPNEAKFVILTDLGNPSIFPNLYTVGLK